MSTRSGRTGRPRCMSFAQVKLRGDASVARLPPPPPGSPPEPPSPTPPPPFPPSPTAGGHPLLVQLLLRHGASQSIPDEAGKVARDVATPEAAAALPPSLPELGIL